MAISSVRRTPASYSRAQRAAPHLGCHVPSPKEKKMGLFSKDIKTLEELFVHGLKEMYYTESQILKALPRLIEHVTNPRLKKGLKDHLKETAEQVSRLDQIFEMREEKPKGTRCSGINGLITEGEDLLGQVGNKAVLDAAIITSAQAVEHYEITRYGALIAWAQKIGRGDFAAILRENLDEELAAAKRLSAIAEGRVNSKAVGHARSRRASKQSASRKRAAGRRKAA
jgi:ferritin-like metal-binding protein YciE